MVDILKKNLLRVRHRKDPAVIVQPDTGQENAVLGNGLGVFLILQNLLFRLIESFIGPVQTGKAGRIQQGSCLIHEEKAGICR